MSMFIQHLLVLALVLACGTFVAWQTMNSLRGKKSRVGSCCAKGCSSQALTSTKQPAERIVFMPVEMLARRK
ncbi:MAG TPA: hypothetical protein VF669_05630 [Tepidisphaeraceae bacterium]|jgi:hypothetical protein